MNSSRAISAARNRRVGEQQPVRSSGPTFSQVRSAPQQQQQQQQQQVQQKPKISVSDAIGLTTIRLCKVENFINELKEGGQVSGLPPNSQVVDNSVLTTMINRLDALEKKEIASSELIKRLERENSDLTVQLRDFTALTNERFGDFDLAFVEIEKQLPTPTEDALVELNEEEVQEPITVEFVENA